MKIGGYDAFDDPYASPGTTVLTNLLDIRDAQTLEAFELEISTLRAEEPLPEGNLDARHYCSVHRHLFQDVYAWAGNYRTVLTSKGGNVFCYPEHIPAQMSAVFERLCNGDIFLDLDTKQFVSVVANFLAGLNAIHPFREGNGRSQMSFVALIGATYGHPFKFERLNPTTFMPAMIASFSGNLDPLKRELLYLLS
jgi:cell filamentation protein